jgi:hypothetical protein
MNGAVAWGQLVEHVKKQHPVVDERGDWLLIAWADQTLQLLRAGTRRDPKLVAVADLWPAALTVAADALELVGRCAVGGLVVRDGILSLREIASLRYLSDGAVDELIDRMRDEAEAFRRLLSTRSGAQRCQGLFATFAE